MRVAIVHDYLAQMGGAEKVVEVLHEMFPEAPVYTSVYVPEAMPASFKSWDIRTSFLQRLPALKKTYRFALPLYPLAFESFDLRGYDLVISSSSAFAKGVITQPHTVHICYTYTPMRFGWMTHSYLEREEIGGLERVLLEPVLYHLRLWDVVAALRVDKYVAISKVVAQRIARFYRRECDIVYPPVDTNRFKPSAQKEDYYLVAARFAPYKRLDLAIEACNRLKRPLKVVGSGRQEAYLRRIAGPTVEFLGRVSDAELVQLMAHARGYIMPGQEDFGISPVEANACGCPVIAYAAGGALDTQVDGVTGVLFPEQSVESLCEALCRAESLAFDIHVMRQYAQRFDTSVFKERIRQIIEEEMAKQHKVVSGERRQNV